MVSGQVRASLKVRRLRPGKACQPDINSSSISFSASAQSCNSLPGANPRFSALWYAATAIIFQRSSEVMFNDGTFALGVGVDFLAAFLAGAPLELTAGFVAAFFTGAVLALTAFFLLTFFTGVALLLPAVFLAVFFLMSGVMIHSCRLIMDALSREYYIYTVQRSSIKVRAAAWQYANLIQIRRQAVIQWQL
jgi:hypothetical protein